MEGEKVMGGRICHVVRCDFCKKIVKELWFDKRDMSLKCINCLEMKL